LDTLDPPELRAGLGIWEDIPIAGATATRIVAEATYHLAAPGETVPPYPAFTPPPITTLAALLPPTPGLSAVLAQLRALCAARSTLRGSRVIREIMGL
jgi:hypothetical protein